MSIGLTCVSLLSFGGSSFANELKLKSKVDSILPEESFEDESTVDALNEIFLEENIDVDVSSLDFNDLSLKEKEKLDIVLNFNDYSLEGVSEYNESIGLKEENKLSKQEAYAIAILVNKEVEDAEKNSDLNYVENNSSRSGKSVFVKINDRGLATTFRKNREQINSIQSKFNSFISMGNFAFAYAYKDSTFASLVKTGGAWDIKRSLPHTYLWQGSYRTGEYIGNYHYGYLGSNLGYSDFTLKFAAGLYQIVSHTSNWQFYTSYFDDPKDTEAIQHGIKNKYVIHY